MVNDPIAAIATAPGRGGIGVVRISGPDLAAFLRALFPARVAPRRATRANFLDAQGALIDQGLILFFPAPRSYTGEDVIELQGHGGPTVLQLLLRRCFELGARAAEPGEFTKRAYLNDKIDLAQAESVADLIDAATAEAARCAAQSLRGDFSTRINELVLGLGDLRALVEASLDFPEEELGAAIRTDVENKVVTLAATLEQILVGSQQGKLLREGATAVLVGEPNVGKSSLMNALAGEELAIVTAVPGTTRDAIRETVAIDGVAFTLVDTAGLRTALDEVEKIGIAKSWEQVARADLLLWVCDARAPALPSAEFLSQFPPRVPCLQVVNKVDLCGHRTTTRDVPADTVYTSAKTGVGLASLRAKMLQSIGWTGEHAGIFMARERHLRALHEGKLALARAAELLDQWDLLAEELRSTQVALEQITGRTSVEDLLGAIFSRFCIGK